MRLTDTAGRVTLSGISILALLFLAFPLLVVIGIDRKSVV